MVPLEADGARLLIGDARALLRRRLEPLVNQHGLDEAFASWVLRDGATLNLDAAAAAAAQRAGAARRSADVGTLGFALSAQPGVQSTRDSFADGARWLTGTSWRSDGVPIGVADDPVALLGVSVGVAAFGDAELTQAVRTWVEPFALHMSSRSDAWEAAIARCAVESLGIPLPTLAVQPEAADVRVALSAVGVGNILAGDQQQALTLAVDSGPELDPLRAVTRLAAIERYLTALNIVAVDAPTIADVVRLLEGLQRALQEWTWEQKARTKGGTPRKWHVDNEYHLQNVLWLVLAPIFPDLRKEDVTPQVGPIQPRADLGIPSLQLIVEAKFVRRKKPLKSVVEQIAADRGLYFVSGSAYERMIAVVWDDGARIEEHETLARGLGALDRVDGAVVLARPGKMNRTDDAEEHSDDESESHLAHQS